MHIQSDMDPIARLLDLHASDLGPDALAAWQEAHAAVLEAQALHRAATEVVQMADAVQELKDRWKRAVQAGDQSPHVKWYAYSVIAAEEVLLMASLNLRPFVEDVDGTNAEATAAER